MSRIWLQCCLIFCFVKVWKTPLLFKIDSQWMEISLQTLVVFRLQSFCSSESSGFMQQLKGWFGQKEIFTTCSDFRTWCPEWRWPCREYYQLILTECFSRLSVDLILMLWWLFSNKPSEIEFKSVNVILFKNFRSHRLALIKKNLAVNISPALI